MNVSIMATCDMQVLQYDMIEEDKGFPMHHSTLTEITTI